MNHNYEFSYKNVYIRPLSIQDIELLRNWRNDEKNTKYLRKLPYITEDMQSEWFRTYITNQDEYCFAIEEIEECKKTVGSLSLYNFNDNRAEFGKILVGDSNAHGKNVGYNSIVAVLYIAFNKLNLDEVFLHVFMDNQCAMHVYSKIGFRVVEIKEIDEKEDCLMVITETDFNKRGVVINE